MERYEATPKRRELKVVCNQQLLLMARCISLGEVRANWVVVGRRKADSSQCTECRP
jgi:hypothetical protein